MSQIIIPGHHQAAPRSNQILDASGRCATGDIDTMPPQLTALQFNLAKSVAELLHTTYPGWLWVTDVSDGGTVNVRNLYLSGNWGFVLHTHDIYSASEFERRVKLAGGELLERYRQARGRLNEVALADLPTDFAGRHKPEM